MLSKISENIQNEVIKLYHDHNIDFNKNKYDRIINMVIHAITSDDTISIVNKLKIYYAGLLYPADNLSFHTFDYENIRKILSIVGIPNYINPEEIVDIIKSKEGIVHDCIKIDNTNPISLIEKARYLLRRGIQLYTHQTPYVKTRTQIFSICHPIKNANITSFMKYIYHEGLFLGDNINTTNKYLSNLLKSNKEHMIELCLFFGDREYITIEDIDDWVNKNDISVREQKNIKFLRD